MDEEGGRNGNGKDKKKSEGERGEERVKIG